MEYSHLEYSFKIKQSVVVSFMFNTRNKYHVEIDLVFSCTHVLFSKLCTSCLVHTLVVKFLSLHHRVLLISSFYIHIYVFQSYKFLARMQGTVGTFKLQP